MIRDEHVCINTCKPKLCEACGQQKCDVITARDPAGLHTARRMCRACIDFRKIQGVPMLGPQGLE